MLRIEFFEVEPVQGFWSILGIENEAIDLFLCDVDAHPFA